MRTPLIAASLFFIAGYAIAETIEEKFNEHTIEIQKERNVPTIIKMVSPVYQAQGTAPQIIQKAQGCVAKHLSNSEVATSGSSGSGLLDAMAGIGHNVNSTISGGALIELVEPSNGQLIANSRVDYKFMLLAHNIKTRFILEAKDGRFRVTQSDIEAVQKNTGSMRNDGYRPLLRLKGIGWDKALAAAIDVEKKVADCIASQESENW